MTYRIVRKPVMGIYNSLDFEIIKIAKTETELKSEEQTNIVSKSYVKKDSKEQNKNRETIIVSNFSLPKKKRLYILSDILNTLTSYDDYNDYSYYDDFNYNEDLYNTDNNYYSDESSNDCNEIYDY